MSLNPLLANQTGSIDSSPVRLDCARRTTSGILAALVGAIGIGPAPAAADTEVQTTLQAGLSGIQTEISPTGPISNAIDGTGPNGLSATSAFGAADFGVLEVDHDSFAVGAENAGGFSSVFFRDDITVIPDDPALNATEGRIIFELRPLGVLRHDPQNIEPFNDSADGNAAYRVAVTGAEVPGSYSGQLLLRPGPGGFGYEESFSGTPLGTPLVFERLVFFGFPNELEVLLNVQTSANVTDRFPATAGYEAMAGVAMVWEGILEVRDSSGNLVADYSVTSGSGVDWSQPVPEPGFALATWLGSAVLLGTKRRSSSIKGRLDDETQEIQNA